MTMQPGGPWIVGEGFPDVVAQIFEAGNTIINSSGFFVYSGTPANGNLIFSIAQAAGTDQFGNTYPAGETWFGTTFQAEQSGQARLKLDQFGNILVFNPSGALIYIVAPSGDGWFLYADTGSATQGALIASATPVAGTDQFGNGYKAGLTVYSSNTQYVNITAGTVRLNNPSALLHPSDGIIEFENSLGIGVGGAVSIFGPGNGGTTPDFAVGDGQAASVPIAAIVSGAAETWNYVGSGGGNPGFGSGWSNRGSPWATLAFRKVASPPNTVQIRGEISATNTAATTIFTLPAGYRPANQQQFATTNGNAQGINITSAGAVNVETAISAAGNWNIDCFLSLDI